MTKRLFLLLLPLFISLKASTERFASFPYITGDGFRALADFLFVETTDDSELPLIIKNFKDGQKIFVKTELLSKFFTVLHPQLKNYILITHNSDVSPGKFVEFLDSPKLIAWFCENCDTYVHHPKFFYLPIGTTNGHSMRDQLNFTYDEWTILREQYSSIKKDIVLYMNFTVHAGVPDRQLAYSLFKDKHFCYHPGNKHMRDYLHDVARSRFVLSPPGGGLDCYRTWEALLMGAIPIVISNTLNPVYEDLPVLIVNDWHDINPDFLKEKYKEITSKQYKMEKIFMPYWNNLINEIQQQYYQQCNNTIIT